MDSQRPLSKQSNKINILLNDYRKRKGTAGLSGQLYETKLLCLILLRTLYSDNTDSFLLGTNMEGLGEFDDIIFRYKRSGMQRSKMIFLQAKHRDDLRRELTMEDIQKQHGDFGVPKYFESYLKIKERFDSNNDDIMFRDSMNDIDCDFIIYTPALENLNKNKIEYCFEDSIVKSNKNGKMFQLKYDNEDIEDLLHNVAKSRAIILAKTFSKFILRDNNNYKNIMLDDLMKTYHVYLAKNVIMADDSPETQTDQPNLTSQESSTNENNDSYYIAKFRPEFLSNKESYLLLMKNVICKEIVEIKSTTSDKVDNVIKSLTFKLPTNFGNESFCFSGTDSKQKKKLTYVCFSILKKLLDAFRTDYKVVLDDDSIGTDKILLHRDLESYRLGGLIGNFLIKDDKSDKLKFNLDENELSDDIIKILRVLQDLEMPENSEDENNKKKYELDKYRFDINITNFPRLSLISKAHDGKLLQGFLSKLKFYTNQAKEDEIESILINEIDRFCNIQHKQNESLIRVKCDAIFLKVHDKIQKWWQQPDGASYLTKTCNFYHEAATEILESPLLNIIHFIYREKIKHIPVEFELKVTDHIQLNKFLNNSERMIVIRSSEINLSIIKMVQYFDETKYDKNYVIVDFDFMVMENCLEIIKSELANSTVPTLVIVTQELSDIDMVLTKLNYIYKQYKGKIIIITDKSLREDLKTMGFKNIQQLDDKTNFSSLSLKTQNMILSERQVIFQGEAIIVDTVLDNSSLNLLSPDFLFKMILNDNIDIGKTLITTFYNESIDYYINRTLNQRILLDDITLSDSGKSDFCYINIDDGVDMDKIPPDNQDIICITKSIETFEEICKMYSRRNIHWFIVIDRYLKWQQSQGTLSNIVKYIKRDLDSNSVLKLNTLDDMQNKIAIISAEPGEGKSTLLTHLAIETKRKYPFLWILKINFLDNIDQFCNWKENKTNIDLTEAIYFLYSAIDIIDFNNFDVKSRVVITTNNTNEIYFINENDETLHGVDLTQIKLFNYFYNNNKLVVLFDGFDEICPDYAKEVILLLGILKSSKVAHLWVTTRPYHVQEQLELALGTFSLHLSPLNKWEQRNFLQNMWSKTVNLDKMSDKILIYRYVDQFLNVLESILCGSRSFTSCPLHLYMIAEMYQHMFRDFIKPGNKPSKLPHNFEKNIRTASILTKMYKQFTNQKFYKIRFGEKNSSMNMKHPDTRKMIEKERKEFVKNHKIISAYLLLDRNIVLTKRDLKDAYEFIDSVRSGEEKSGFVECITSNRPSFSHFTFAEYFAVEFIFDKLLSGNCSCTLWEYLIRDIISNDNGIHRFINSKLQNESIMNDLTSNKEHTNMISSIITQDSTNYFKAISVAIEHSYEYSAIFMLKCAITTVNKDNLISFIELINIKYGKHCIFCATVANDAQSTTKFLIELVSDIDSDKLLNLFYCQDSCKCNPMLVIRDERDAILMLTMLKNSPEAMLELFTSSLQLCQYETIYTIVNRFQKISREYLLGFLTVEQRVKIFSIRDPDGKLPVHYAAQENDYDFFVAIDDLVGREEFKNMCMSADNAGLTSISKFPYNELFFDKFKNLLDMVYNDPYIDFVKLKFNELSYCNS